MQITVNGDPYEIPEPLTVADLLTRLHIDARRVAVERNLTVIKRALFDTTVVDEGDQIEIVNFVGGGAPAPVEKRRRLCESAPERSGGRASA